MSSTHFKKQTFLKNMSQTQLGYKEANDKGTSAEHLEQCPPNFQTIIRSIIS